MGSTSESGRRGSPSKGSGPAPTSRLPTAHEALRPVPTLVQRCVSQLRIRDLVTYQPPSKYWVLQWYEMAIFLGAALVLVGFCFWFVRRRLV